MKNHSRKLNEKKMLTKLLALIMVLSVALSAMSPGMGIVAKAALADYPVELAFNNIFVFDRWAGNKLSTTMVSGGTPVKDELAIDIETGSFHFENPYSTEAYTGHGMGTGQNAAGNYQYYVMEVEPGTAYTFSYNATFTTSSFTPFVFFFNENNEYTSLVAQPAIAGGDNEFVFFTPSNSKYIQIRFTLPEKGSADVKNIAIRKTEIASYGENIYDFDAWANNANSNDVSPLFPNGTITNTDTDNNSITLTTNGGTILTNFTFGADGKDYYMADVEPNTRYNYSYNLSSCDFSVACYKPYVAFYNEEGQYLSYVNTESVRLGTNSFIFTTPANAEYIQIVYGIEGVTEAGKSCTVKDVAIQKINLVADSNSDLPHRKVYTYSTQSPATYGELPTPSYAPDGYVFAGWYTGVNGTGEHITENTPVHFSSYTVYPKYEPIASALTVKTMPVKTSYTVGERVNPTGLVLEATVEGEKRTIDSGYYCTPEYLTATGTQTVTAHYGGKTATFTVNVSASASESVVINGSTVNASVTNNVYTLNYSTSAFNKYEMTYYSEAYVQGIMTYDDGTTEEFFLEPSSNFEDGNAEFTSLIDGYLEKVIAADRTTEAVNTHTRSGIKSIAFTPLDNESGDFSLLSVATTKVDAINSNEAWIKYFQNDEYKVGVDLLNGGVVNYLEALNSGIEARVYKIDGRNATKVDYADKLDSTYGTDYVSKSTSVNLINYYDTGRYLQQSYYGTSEKPYEQGYYNYADWNYNPVQGGNVANEASKVIDFEITDEYIYIKARPLDWAKYSDEFAEKNTNETEFPTKNFGEDYVTDTYIEAKYVFEDGMMKVYNRMVDYSGLPTAQTTQELPAFYTIEPLNQYVYNDVSKDEAWKTKNLKYDSEPEFWGINQDYVSNIYNGNFSANRDTHEHWAAFMASQAPDSFGIGLYSPEVTNFFYGMYPAKYDGVSTNNKNYRHAETTNPAIEDDSTYVAPVEVRTFESYKPTEYAYYISTGTVDQIRNSFGVVDSEEFAKELSKGKIAVPETIYMTPSSGESKTGQYYVNNIIDENGVLTTEAKNNQTNGNVQFYISGAKSFKVAVNTVTSGVGDAVLSGISENTAYTVTDKNGHYTFNTAQLNINGTGLTAGQTALAEWVFTVTMDDGSVRTYYAYSTLYAPYTASVGAVAFNKGPSKVYASGIAWIVGVHSRLVADSTNTGNSNTYYRVKSATEYETLTSTKYYQGLYYPNTSGTRIMDTLISDLNLANGELTPIDWFSTSNTGVENAFRVTKYDEGNKTDLQEVSPIAQLTVDTSRYTNFSQIPNLNVGYQVTDVDNAKNTWWYFADYSDVISQAATYGGSSSSKNQIKSNREGSEQNIYDDGIANTSSVKVFGSSGSPGTWDSNWDAGSDYQKKLYDGIWDRNIRNSGSGKKDYYVLKGSLHAKSGSSNVAYTHTYVQIEATNINKSTLRDLVIEGSGLNENNYTTASWNAYKQALQNAAAKLGNPSASDIEEATNALITARNSLKRVTVVFDSLIDFNYFEKSPVTNGVVTDFTNSQFTLTSGDGAENEAYVYSNLFPVTEGKKYVIELDYEGTSPEVFFFFCKENGEWVNWSSYTDLSSGKLVYSTTATGYTHGIIRLDSNGNNNSVTFKNIRVYEEGAVVSGTSYNPPIVREDGTEFIFPTPEKEGFDFIGWFDANGNEVTPENISRENEVTTLYSKWQLNNDSLKPDVCAVDFGVKTLIKPFNNDTVLSQAIIENGWYDYQFVGLSKDGTSFSTEITGEYGTYSAITDITKLEVYYTPTKVMSSEETVYYRAQIETPAGTATLTDTITLAPASNVYYEEGFAADKGVEASVKWDEEKNNNGNLAASVINDVYGYDKAYDNKNNFSDNSYLSVTLTNENPRSETKIIDFAGSGFDLVSACGINTGVQVVKVSKLQADGKYKAVKAYIVDTYFTDTDIMENNLLHQVPIVNFRGEYGTYQVEATAVYLQSASALGKSASASLYNSDATLGAGEVITANAAEPTESLINELESLGFEDMSSDVQVVWMDDNSVFNGGTGVQPVMVLGELDEQPAGAYLENYIDGFRVYNPLDGGSGAYPASEQNATYYNIVNDLAKSGESNFAYIESGSGDFNFDAKDENGNSYDFDAYNNQGGPKGEIYLKKGQGIAFKFSAQANGNDAAVMLGMRAVKGNAEAKINNAGNPVSVTSKTEMYYDVSDVVSIPESANEVTVYVVNNGEEGSVLAVNNLKLVNGELVGNGSGSVSTGSNNIVGGNMAVPTPVAPNLNGSTAEGSEPESTLTEDNSTILPETDGAGNESEKTENGTENEESAVDNITSNLSSIIPGLPASVASFLEMLLKLLSQLISSGF